MANLLLFTPHLPHSVSPVSLVSLIATILCAAVCHHQPNPIHTQLLLSRPRPRLMSSLPNSPKWGIRRCLRALRPWELTLLQVESRMSGQFACRHTTMQQTGHAKASEGMPAQTERKTAGGRRVTPIT